MRKLTKEIVIKQFNKVHKNKYDYSLFENYEGVDSKIDIICPIHGVFNQQISHHKKGVKCPKCAIEDIKKKHSFTDDEFIMKAKEIHNNFYNYENVKYINIRTKVKIICPVHGIFEQTPSAHIYQKQGCPRCSGKIRTNKNFIYDANKKHNNKYDYSLVVYKNSETKVKIICPNHGIFLQTPHSHLQGNGCPICAGNIMTNEMFIEKAKEIHKNKYDYSDIYENSHKKLRITCKKHGDFYIRPNNHLSGQGCPKCANIKKRLRRIKEIERDKLNGNQIIPSYNPKACKIFDEISEKNNIHIQHAMNGGEYHIKELGYFVDGYDKENNVVYEYDEKYHKYQIEKDLIREEEIKNYLKCKIIRIKE